MRRFCAVLFLLVLPLGGADPPRADLQRITASALKAHVSFLASDLLEGRGTPSRGLDVAGEYIAAQFTRIGLEPVPGAAGFFQNAEFVQVTANLEGAELTIETAGSKIAVPADRLSVTGAQPAGASLDGVEAVKVAAAAGVTVERVAGKVVIIETPDYAAMTGDERRKFYEVFSQLRAKLNDAKPAAVVMVGATALPQPAGPVRRLASTADPAVLWLRAGDPALLNAVRTGQTFKATLHVPEPRREPVILRNVAGLVRGSDPKLKDTYVIVSAHYDHMGVRSSGDGDRIMNGANDNASGTASMIETAAALVNARPRRSVLFIAWFGEEMGLLGSRYYVRRPLVPLEKTIADINLEQTGRTDAIEGPAAGRAAVTGFDLSEVGGILIEVGRELGVNVIENPKLVDPYFARSDNVTFADLGIPAHTVSVALQYPDYHRPSDHADKLDYENMEKVTKFIAASVATIADRDRTPKWNTQNPAAERYVRAGSQK